MIDITYFVHSSTEDNILKICSGWNDVPLSEKGFIQANNLKILIENENFDIVFCSDLLRAIQTADALFSNKNIPIIPDRRLRECNYGKLNGASADCIIYSEHIMEKFENGESIFDVCQRIENLVDYIKNNCKNKKVAIIGHRATQIAFDVILKNMSIKDAINSDWRINKNGWKPGWKYIIE